MKMGSREDTNLGRLERRQKHYRVRKLIEDSMNLRAIDFQHHGKRLRSLRDPVDHVLDTGREAMPQPQTLALVPCEASNSSRASGS